MSTLGKASEGVRIGYDKGFDSGSTLDYVYRNQAQGSGLFGRIIDRQYLNSIGWQGIRQRKVNIENIIRQAIRELSNSGKPVRIMDIAAGQGRYIFDAINDYGKVDSVLLRDYSPINVEQGRLHIKERYLEDKIRFEEGNAFDADDLAAVSPAPTLGIVSGLYELFPSNELIRASLDGLSRAIPSGGLLIYTCQPWHPQVEMIARVLPSHQGGKAWVMRCRSQGEMDALVEEAGFEKSLNLSITGVFLACPLLDAVNYFLFNLQVIGIITSNLYFYLSHTDTAEKQPINGDMGTIHLEQSNE